MTNLTTLIRKELTRQDFTSYPLEIQNTYNGFVIFKHGVTSYTLNLTKTNKVKRNSLILCSN